MNAPIRPSKALLLSIRPTYANLILSGEKTIELRKVRPRIAPGTLVVIYASSPTCALVGAFRLREIVEYRPSELWKIHGSNTGVTKAEFDRYYADREHACGLVVGEVMPLKTTVTLSELRRSWQRFHPPQSYRYLRQAASKQSVTLSFKDQRRAFSLGSA